MTSVLICGGGIAGLTAAHELSLRGFDVTVLERNSFLGGKARSIDVAVDGGDGTTFLPGEHGFRFFPGFYHHLTDLMGQIPFGDKTVLDNLVPTTEMLMARAGMSDLNLPSEPPDTVSEALAFFGALTGDLGIPLDETFHFSRRMFQFLSSGNSRREEEFDHVSWWDFINADGMSDGYKKFLGEGATRSLVAMRADVSSTKTIATIYFQMVAHLMSPVSDVDRLLNGPTNDVWIDPWEQHLRNHGVKFLREHAVRRIDVEGDRVIGIDAEFDNKTVRFTADHYVAALPVEVMITLLNDDLTAAAPQLASIEKLETAWMNGIQYYLKEDVPLVRGHGLFLDAPWALTSISQAQFWDRPVSSFGDGDVKGILSIVISDWDRPGILFGRPAKNCTRDEIQQEVWAQLIAHLHDDELDELNATEVVQWFLDDSIQFPNPHEAVNLEPLLINTVGSWANRPSADLGMRNFFIAADYVKTNTDLATMEGATEAARRATNAIIARERGKNIAKIYRYREWDVLSPLRYADESRYKKTGLIGALFSLF